MYGGYSSAGDTAWTTAYYQNLLAQQNKKMVDQAFSRFTPAWYQKRADAYTMSAMPQLQEQYLGERKNLTYALANRGLSKSSAANEQFTNLGNEMTRQKQNIVNAGQQFANQLKQQIAQSQVSLYQLGGTPGTGSTNAAMLSAAGYTAPNATAPLTDYMQQFNQQLFNRLALSAWSPGTSTSGAIPTSSYSPANLTGPAGDWSGSAAYTVKD